MNKVIVLACLVLFLAANVVYSHPPSGITLAYDKEAKTLNIEMAHVTNDLNKHFIRRLELQKNSDEPVILTSFRQNDFQKIVRSISVDALAGDSISIKAICSQGGIGSASVVVEADEPEESEETESTDGK